MSYTGIGGPRWKEQRRFAAKSLKDLYEGQTGKFSRNKIPGAKLMFLSPTTLLGMEEKIHTEVSFTIQHLRNLLAGKKEEMMYDADRFWEVPNLNVIWGLVAALRHDFKDPVPKKQFQYMRTLFGEKLAGIYIFFSASKTCPFFVCSLLIMPHHTGNDINM